ncbi:MAG: CDP-alcohol phosphatidyltransferase family protein [Clostridiales bacterium]|nr:CDP-alcohol phosphatidyltransferase family protein [Clostridiales bacterium]
MNIPNMLSVVRICLVPVFILVYFSGSPNSNIYAAIVYAVASITDILDGRIARKNNITTNLGRILDPLGDKLMTMAVIVSITIDRVIPVWAVIIFLAKECMMGLGGLFLYNKFEEMPPSNYFGKCSTVVFFAVCVILMLFRNIPHTVALVMISFALAVMLLAFVSYIIKFVRLLKMGEQSKS